MFSCPGVIVSRDDDDDDDVFIDSDTSSVSLTSPKRRSQSLSALKEEPKSPRKASTRNKEVCITEIMKISLKQPPSYKSSQIFPFFLK